VGRTITRRQAGALLIGAGACLVAYALAQRLRAQEQAPSRHEFTLTARNYRYTPDRIEVAQDDLVRITIRSEDMAYSFTVDEYRIVRRVPPGGTTAFEFRADRPGTFRFYSNLTSDSAHAGMEGQLIVKPR
jgi:heme/copper-type cytochrome/quinol oxidase subunit 2